MFEELRVFALTGGARHTPESRSFRGVQCSTMRPASTHASPLGITAEVAAASFMHHDCTSQISSRTAEAAHTHSQIMLGRPLPVLRFGTESI